MRFERVDYALQKLAIRFRDGGDENFRIAVGGAKFLRCRGGENWGPPATPYAFPFDLPPPPAIRPPPTLLAVFVSEELLNVCPLLGFGVRNFRPRPWPVLRVFVVNKPLDLPLLLRRERRTR